jgi:hypothetical protein
MSFVFTKVAVIDIAICVVPYSLAVHFAFLKFTLISAEVGPLHYSSSLELVFDKLPNVDFSAIGKVILTLAMELTLDKVSLVCWSLEFEFTFPCFLTLLEISLVLYAVEVP